MDCKDKIRELRESTGMNRKEFCKYFEIPYRTVTEWELGGRHAPEYVLRLLEYYIRAEKLEQSSKAAQDKNKEKASWSREGLV
jgi:transcriptional regulator with XRE-family HTH domain